MATIQWRKHKRKDGRVTRTATLNWSEGGERCRTSLGAITEKEARQRLAIKEAELVTQAQIVSTAPMFEAVANYYLDWRKSEYPDSHYRVEQLVEDHLIPAFRYNPVDTLKPLQVEKYKHDRLRVVSVETVTKEIRQLKAIINKAVEWQMAALNPIKSVRPPKNLHSKPMHWYTMEELLTLYEHSGTYRPIWQLMANTGIRRGEAQNLKLEHDRGESIVIQSEHGARTKSGKWREIPLSANARDALDQLVDQSRTEYILPVMNKVSLSRSFGRCRDKGRLDGTLHSLRHTFGTLLAVKGVKIMELKELMGHSSVTTTERYLHVARDHLQHAIQGFNI